MSSLWRQKLDWQATLFAPRLRRSDLLSLQGDWPLRKKTVHVWRNQPFEYIAQALTPFLAFSDYAIDISYSDYDDAFSLTRFVDADVHIVSFDIDHYSAAFRAAELDAWFAQQLAVLRAQTVQPVLVMNWISETCHVTDHNAALAAHAAQLTDTFVVDCDAVCQALGPAFWDGRARSLRACGWSDAGTLHMAREFGLRALPGVLGTLIKAIVADFDDTLVEGVLGEDGIAGVHVTTWHRELQEHLQTALQNGVMLGIASRNVASDVEDYFRSSTDTVLQRQDFAAFEVSWDSKADAIARIARQFNIGMDAVLFIDDNLGQLAEVAEALPLCHILAATEATVAGAHFYPGLLRFRRSSEDALRSADIMANRAREQIAQQATTPQDYLRSLDVSLCFQLNAETTYARLAELSGKTNQFNLALARLSETALRAAVADGGGAIAVSMRDRLSDSGIIAFILASVENDALLVHEICISCRALGRSVETLIVFKALALAIGQHTIRRILFSWQQGPRNSPALEWLATTASCVCPDERGTVTMPWDPCAIEQLIAATPVIIEES